MFALLVFCWDAVQVCLLGQFNTHPKAAAVMHYHIPNPNQQANATQLCKHTRSDDWTVVCQSVTRLV